MIYRHGRNLFRNRLAERKTMNTILRCDTGYGSAAMLAKECIGESTVGRFAKFRDAVHLLAAFDPSEDVEIGSKYPSALSKYRIEGMARSHMTFYIS
jgi:hypothetical protein